MPDSREPTPLSKVLRASPPRGTGPRWNPGWRSAHFGPQALDPPELVKQWQGILADIERKYPIGSTFIEEEAASTSRSPRTVQLALANTIYQEAVEKYQERLRRFDKGALRTYDPNVRYAGTLVTLPAEMQRSLQALAMRRDNVEYGGGIDFCTVNCKHREIDRVIEFLGGEKAVSAEMFRKWAPDSEASWHTHPVTHSYPSISDVLMILDSPYQAMIIVAKRDISVYARTDRTTTVPISESALKKMAVAGGAPWLGLYPVTSRQMMDIDKFLTDVLGLEVRHTKRAAGAPKPIEFTIQRLLQTDEPGTPG